MRIGILTQYYPPEMGAPQGRLSHLAREFVRRGHEVVVLTAMPNYPTGRVFPGYGGVIRRETREGVRVVRAAIWPSQSVRTLPRLTSYFSFVFSSILVGAFALPRLDYLVTESPPLFLGIAGWLLALRTGARFVFNVSDLWPESAVRLGALGPGPALHAAEALEAFCYRRAWLVTGQSREILDHIHARFPDVPVYHLSNGVDTELFRPERGSAESRASLLDGEPAGSCVALYAGLHGIAQGLEQILDAAARLAPERPVVFVLIGDGPEKPRLVARARELGLSRVRFLDPRPREEMPALLASADVAVIPLKTPLPGAVPSKIYEAMGAGVPIVLIAGGEAASIVSGTGAGVALTPGDAGALADTLGALADDAERRETLGRSGRQAALERFDRRDIAERFIAQLERGASC
jgi:colanic acid biosynthesis glycosyl transferase WcaI